MSAPSTARPTPPADEPPTTSRRARSRVPGLLAALVVVLGLLVLAFLAGRSTPWGSEAGGELIPVLDVEFDFIGAVRTWQEEGSTEDPFADMNDAELVEAGRTACLRATDADMSFNGMLDLLGTSPHQTYAILAEASDKLCPSHADSLGDIMAE